MILLIWFCRESTNAYGNSTRNSISRDSNDNELTKDKAKFTQKLKTGDNGEEENKKISKRSLEQNYNSFANLERVNHDYHQSICSTSAKLLGFGAYSQQENKPYSAAPSSGDSINSKPIKGKNRRKYQIHLFF